MMPRTVLTIAIALAAGVAGGGLAGGRFAQAGPAVGQTDSYFLVDPNAKGRGKPGFVFQDNMANVRRVGTGRYCLRSKLRYSHGPVALTTVDGILPNGGFGIAVSDQRARYCNRGMHEEAVATFIIINYRARPSSSVRFIGDTLG